MHCRGCKIEIKTNAVILKNDLEANFVPINMIQTDRFIFYAVEYRNVVYVRDL